VTQLVLEVLEGKDAGLQVQMTGPIEVGTEAGLGLTLDDSVVGARHARFTIEQGEAIVEDLGSPDGTYVNELQLIGRSAIRPGDRIRLGMTVIELVTEEQAVADRHRPKMPAVPQLAATVLEHVPEHELASGYDTSRATPLLAAESDPAFIAHEAPAAPRPEDRFGALAAWTDSRVKHQTQLTAFGLLAFAAIAVLLVFFH
jgi:pSer/pThr/pTyr-binding forkhead associated (FHA) protein